MSDNKPENQDQKESSNSNSSAFDKDKKIARQFVNQTVQSFIRWMPLGGSGFFLVNFVSQQEWFMALVMFPVMIVTVVWAAYSKSVLTRFSQVYDERGKQDVDSLMKWIDNTDKAIRETIKWQLAGVETKYLKCLQQTDDCLFHLTEGFKHKESNLLLANVFVPSEITGEFVNIPPGFNYPSEEYREIEAKTNVDIWTLLKKAQKNPAYYSLIVRAKGGLGKTTLLRHLTYVYANKKYRSYHAPKLIPVLLYLRRWQEEIVVKNKPDLPTLIEDYYIPNLPGGKDLKFPSNWSKNHLGNGQMLIMFDGFDEVKKEWRIPLSKWIGQQLKNYPQSFFILTSRPLGYHDYKSSIEPKTRLWVKPFNDEQKARFIQRWYRSREKNIHGQIKSTPSIIEAKAKQKADNLIKQIKERQELDKLARNPLMLNIMVNLHCLYQSKDLPKKRTELYREIILLQLGDRPLAKDIELVLEAEDSQKVLQGLALSMLILKSRQVEYQDLIKKIKKQFSRHNIESSIKPEIFLEQVEKVSELIVKIDDYYEFAHLSFQEYLAAVEIKETKQEHLFLENWRESWWKETILLYASLVNPNNLLRGLINIGSKEAVVLAYECIKDTPRKIDVEVEEELKELEKKVANLLYQDLEEYLKNGQWREADEETGRLMLKVAGREEEGWLNGESIDNFPCEDLRTIDQLWVKYSNGHFGFSVQKKIYFQLGGTKEYNGEVWNNFCDRVGWRKGGKWLNYNDLTFDISKVTPQAYLPSRGVRNWEGLLFSRVQTCKL